MSSEGDEPIIGVSPATESVIEQPSTTSPPPTSSSVSATSSPTVRVEEEIQQENKEDARLSAWKNVTRRRVVIGAVVLLVAAGIVMIIVAGVITSQIQNTVQTGPSPPVDERLPSSVIVGKGGTYIGQGGSLISRPMYLYAMYFIDDIYLAKVGTQGGVVLWRGDVQGLTPTSNAILQLSEFGVLQVLDQNNNVLWASQQNPNAAGNYAFQVTETSSTNGTGGQLQIVNSSGDVIWYVGASDPDGPPP